MHLSVTVPLGFPVGESPVNTAASGLQECLWCSWCSTGVLGKVLSACPTGTHSLRVPRVSECQMRDLALLSYSRSYASQVFMVGTPRAVGSWVSGRALEFACFCEVDSIVPPGEG